MQSSQRRERLIGHCARLAPKEVAEPPLPVWRALVTGARSELAERRAERVAERRDLGYRARELGVLERSAQAMDRQADAADRREERLALREIEAAPARFGEGARYHALGLGSGIGAPLGRAA